jgi:hypothetical protein
MLWLSFPMSVITAYAADKYIKFDDKVKASAFPVLAIILLFVSNINTVGVSHGWNYPEEEKFISGVATPPKDAEVFYIIDTADSGDPADIYQMDAFEIATVYSLKTINGYSGQFPSGWGGIWDVSVDTYEQSVFEWIEEYKLSNVYAYDRAQNLWISAEDRMLAVMDD